MSAGPRIEAEVARALEQGPASGADLIETLRANEEPILAEGAVLVYGALANLAARGEAALLEKGPGEAIWGTPGSRSRALRPPGAPASFGLKEAQLAFVDIAVAKLTRGLPPHYFEELRRVTVADADRLVHQGAEPDAAARMALSGLGPESAAHRVLSRANTGKTIRLRLRARRRVPAWVTFLLVAGLCIFVLRVFVIAIYRVPTRSMAPALAPEGELGDQRVLVNSLAYRFGAVDRGDIVVFDQSAERDRFVKRAMGLPGERIRVVDPDLQIDGKRLVKERALLDRVSVPLFAWDGLEHEGQTHRTPYPLHDGYLRDDNTVLPEPSFRRPAFDLVMSFRIRVAKKPTTVSVRIDEGLASPHWVFLSTEEGRGSAVSGGLELERDARFLLEPGFWRNVWITNADRVFRVELDGREACRAPVTGSRRRSEGTTVGILVLDGDAEFERLVISRDIIHRQAPGAGPDQKNEWLLGPNEVFLLGDNTDDSVDSRHFGPISTSALRGKVFAVIWPLDRARWIR
ncbi:MAG: signal peptidase I [Planctomycetota bacterium]